MNLTKKIILLVVCQVLVIVGCLYLHLKDFDENSKKTKMNKEEVLLLDSVAEIKKDDSEVVPSEPIESQEVVDEISKDEEKVIKSDEIEKTANLTTDTKIENISKDKEISKVNEAVGSKEITAEKVKSIFEKKKEKNSKIDTQDKYEKLNSNISKILEKNKIVFKRLSTEVSEESISTIEEIAKVLKNNPEIKVEVGGHTDAKGDDEVNNYVSKHRALSVKKMLIEFGVDEKMLTSKGYGESQPLVDNNPDGYSMKNRRVEFKLIKE